MPGLWHAAQLCIAASGRSLAKPVVPPCYYTFPGINEFPAPAPYSEIPGRLEGADLFTGPGCNSQPWILCLQDHSPQNLCLMENPPSQQSVFPNQGGYNPLPNASAVLVLGIVSIVGCFCYGVVGLACGIIGIVLANKDMQRYRAAPELYTPSSYSNLKAGRICSIIGTSLSALYVIIAIIFFAIWGSFVTNPVFWQQLQNR